MYTLRPYQQMAVQNTIQYFKQKSDPAVIVLPTGAGKSLVIAELARVAKGRVLVLAHVKELVEQNHKKYESYDLRAGIYSAGLNRKQSTQKVIFGSIQSVARANDKFFEDFSLFIIDECHRVQAEGETQYATVIEKLRENNPQIRILGLTATPYRLGMGWIYQVSHTGKVQTTEERFFKHCVFELPLEYMIQHKYLTQPVKIDIPVTSYDFSELSETGKLYTTSQVEELLKKQKRLTPLIIKNIIEITEGYERKGVMIFSGSVRHAEEIMQYLPEGQAKMVIGETDTLDRDEIIDEFKQQKFKYLVNVSVLTTGFDAPHVDVIAILRPTESVSLYQQIIGRGLRLSEGKKDCFILDYTGMGHDIYQPEISERKPSKESEPVLVDCPKCGFENTFWGYMTAEGDVIEHFGRKCRGGEFMPETQEVIPCGYRFRFKICPGCGEENDVTARECHHCDQILIDADSKLKQTKLSKNAFILKPDSIQYEKKQDRRGSEYLSIRYYDADGKFLNEAYYFGNATNQKKFSVNFLRSHLRRPELAVHFTSIDDVIAYQKLLRHPQFVIARKQEKFWKVTEKIFSEELSSRYHHELNAATESV